MNLSNAHCSAISRVLRMLSPALLLILSATQSVSAQEKLPRGALMPALHLGFDTEPEFQIGVSVDGYLRITKRFSLGLRVGFVNTLNIGYDLPVVPQIPLDLLLSWDFILKRGRILIPLTAGAGISFLPAYSHQMYIDLFTVETGVKIRLSKKVWLALLVGSRAQLLYYYKDGPSYPSADFRFLVGPYIRF